MILRRTFNFGKIDLYDCGRKINEVQLIVELKNADTEKPVFSVCGKAWNIRHTDIVCSGQCLDRLEPFFTNNKRFKLIKSLWDKYHLNDCHAGTPEQEECLKEFEYEREDIKFKIIQEKWNKDRLEYHLDEKFYNSWTSRYCISHYDISCRLLEKHNLLTVELDGQSYKYGTKWLYQAIPENDLDLIKQLLDGTYDRFVA